MTRPVALGPQVIRLRPAPHARTRIPSYSLKITPARASRELAERPARQLGRALHVSRKRPPSSRVTVDLHAELAPFNPFDFFIEPYAVTYPFTLPGEFAHELGGYLDPEPLGPAAARASWPRCRAGRSAPCSS